MKTISVCVCVCVRARSYSSRAPSVRHSVDRVRRGAGWCSLDMWHTIWSGCTTSTGTEKTKPKHIIVPLLFNKQCILRYSGQVWVCAVEQASKPVWQVWSGGAGGGGATCCSSSTETRLFPSHTSCTTKPTKQKQQDFSQDSPTHFSDIPHSLFHSLTRTLRDTHKKKRKQSASSFERTKQSTKTDFPSRGKVQST